MTRAKGKRQSKVRQGEPMWIERDASGAVRFVILEWDDSGYDALVDVTPTNGVTRDV